MKNKKIYEICRIIQLVELSIYAIIMTIITISSKGKPVPINSITGKVLITTVAVTVITYLITSVIIDKYRMWRADKIIEVIAEQIRSRNELIKITHKKNEV